MVRQRGLARLAVEEPRQRRRRRGGERHPQALHRQAARVHRHVEVGRRDRRGRRRVDDRPRLGHNRDRPVDALAEREVLGEVVADARRRSGRARCTPSS